LDWGETLRVEGWKCVLPSQGGLPIGGTTERENRLEGNDRRQATMDDYMFQSYVKDCKCVTEATSYLEILNYSVRKLRVCDCGGTEGWIGWSIG
jgi:hypothetical protein